MKKSRIMHALMLIIVVALIATNVNAKEVRWKMASTWVPSINLIDADRYFVRNANDLLKGKMKIDFFEGGVLMPIFEVFDAVSEGMLQATGDAPLYWSGKDLVFETLGSYPMGMTAMDMYVWINAGEGQAIYDEAYGKFNMKYLVTGITPSESGLRSNKPLTGLKDLKGMKVRMSGNTQGKILKEAGAAAIMMSGQEIYQALQKGVIDAGEFCTPFCDWGMGFQEVTKYWLGPGWHQPSCLCGAAINKPAWDALDEELQTALKIAAMAGSMEFVCKQYYGSMEYMQKFIDAGTTISKYSDEELDQIARWANKFTEERAKQSEGFKKSMKSQVEFRKNFADWREFEGRFSFGWTPSEFPNL